jgi:peptide/nickel transport system permease protein
MILEASGLSYIGMGVQPPNPEWGAMLSEAREVMRTYPYLITIPGIFIIITALSFNLFGDGLRDAIDPRLKT